MSEGHALIPQGIMQSLLGRNEEKDGKEEGEEIENKEMRWRRKRRGGGEEQGETGKEMEKEGRWRRWRSEIEREE